jgi:Fe2+ or Zn2+ uptake regulation protein
MVTERNATPNAQKWLAQLRQHGYRLTASRQAVVEIIASSSKVLRPQEVFALARQRHPQLGLVTVYRTVEKLEEIGLIQRVHQPSGCQAFVTAAQEHQHLLICTLCGKAQFFSGDHLDGLIEVVGDESGYQVHDHWLQLFGLCQDCQ